MKSRWEISGDDLEQWASRVEASYLLPNLIRRLLLATTPLDALEMRADGGTRYEGWDGVARARDGAAFCPPGVSVWEMSVEKGIKSKIEKDYAKRSQQPVSGVKAAMATYVAVTPRRLPPKQKKAWLDAKRALGTWTEVRVYDADDLATWLEQAPAVGRWLATQIGKPAYDCRDVESLLKGWRELTTPSLPHALVLSGEMREEQARELLRWLSYPPGRPLFIVGDTRQEALVFAAAALNDAPQALRWLSRAVVVESNEAWRWALEVARKEPLIVLPDFEGVDPGQVATSKNHVIVPMERSASIPQGSNLLQLEAMPFRPMQRALVRAGWRDEEAERLVLKAGGSLAALQRLCGYVELPGWAKGSSRPELYAFLLAGAWTPKNEADRTVLLRLGADPGAVDLLCADLEKRGEVDRIKEHWSPEVWQWKSSEMAWKALASGVTELLRERFRDVVLEVLGASEHSGALRQGLALSMVMFSLYGEEPGQRLSEELVYRLLDAKKGWLPWASLSRLLPTLAEAAPTAFLDRMEKSLDRGDEGVSHLFAEEGGFLGSAPHTDLLWALETLGWSPNLMMVRRVAHALARLAARDPGGRLANRPIASLSALLHVFCPQSSTTVEQRLSILQGLLGLELERPIGWSVALGMLEALRGTMVMPAHRPKHLPWHLPEKLKESSYQERKHQLEGVLDLLLSHVGNDPTRWADLVNLSAPRLPEAWVARILDTLKAACEHIVDPEAEVWAALRSRICHLPEELVDSEQRRRLDALYELFTPKDFISTIAWLFDYKLMLPEPREWLRDHRERDAEQDRLRDDAVFELWQKEERWNLLPELVARVKEPYPLGVTLGRSPFAEELEQRLLSGSSDDAYARILAPFVVQRVRERLNDSPFSWLESVLSELMRLTRSDDAIEIATSMWSSKELWDLLDTIGDPLRAEYWRTVGGIYGDHAPEQWERVITQLLDVSRETTAAKAASASRWTISSEMALRILKRMADRLRNASSAAAAQSFADTLDHYTVEKVFEVVDRDPGIDVHELITLELTFLSFLEDSPRSARHLFDALGSSRELFVQLVGMMYRRKGEEAPTDEAELQKRRNAFNNAYRILSAWKGYPGQGLPDNEREAKLEEWAREVLEKTRAEGRGDIASVHVAEVLARAPDGSDGHWPCLAARKLIEKGVAPHLADHLNIAKHNLRGVTSRDLDEGGVQEREVADTFRAAAEEMQDEYPRTAVMLEKLAQDYYREASDEDHEAKRHRLVYGEDEERTAAQAEAPNASDAPGGPLERLEIRNVGPAQRWQFELAPRLNLLTGDNSLGKTFVLDILWWTLTRTWADHMARPSSAQRKTKGKTALNPPAIEAMAGSRRLVGRYDRLHERWKSNARLAHGLTIYACVDGGFSVWDPLRNAPPTDEDELDLSAGYHFTPDELWNRLSTKDGKIVLCNGLLDDAVSWRSERPDAFDMLEKALAMLSLPQEPIQLGRPRRFRIKDSRDFPTLLLPYGETFAIHASAAVKRILGLAYVLVWAVSEIRRAAPIAELDPLRHVTLLIDEIEAHLHPRWQRTILPALLKVVDAIAPQASVQIVTTTHAPLVLASVEQHFNPKTDALFDFELTTTADGAKKVDVEKEPWRLHGDVNAWLTSEIFGLKAPRSLEAEKLIARAEKAMEDPDIDPKLARIIHRKLRKVLNELDPFWIRWRFIAEKRGWLS